MGFILNLNTKIQNPYSTPAVNTAVSILERDIKKTLDTIADAENTILLCRNESLCPETYEIHVVNDYQLLIKAGDDLGFVYALLSISEKYLGIRPFWFWLDQKIEKIGSVEIPCEMFCSPIPAVRFRGWFLNDEVLLIHWNNGEAKDFPWRMAFEALLRCGGNMVIPGTDKSSRIYGELASSYGLWLTHHHAEPLGAEIFARAYPDLLPSYSKNPECFHKLWEDAILRQKDKHVIWTLGFRGQGDCPFWESKGEEDFDTPKKRGELISSLIELQRQLVCKYVKDPVFCTNLYGEIMELYNEGYITLHPDIIKIWADNGYGKMCTRRQDNHCTRTPALPHKGDKGPHGVYYHISFHDLQAASHMTTLPNTVDFVNRELGNAFHLGVKDYWIINSSNIRPHVYYLDAIRKLWFGESVSDASHSQEFARTYYNNNQNIASCLESYAKSLLSYGEHEDQHAGEQFYNYCVRLLARQFIIDRTEFCEPLLWLTGRCSLLEQVNRVLKINKNGEAGIKAYHQQCLETSESLSGDLKTLFDSTVLLQAEIHYHCNQGAILFCQGFLCFDSSTYKESFYFLGRAAEEFQKANTIMRQSEYGVWKGFYENDCLTDIKFTAYVIRSMMRVVRVIGDDQRFAEWYEDFVRPREDRKVRLLSITENHMTDEALFEAMKKAGFKG
ncbi:MAG TPA: glycosyl hydrolase 115 family protein [Candidatus Hungatella pullicola]|nr:glycosyl hydrolase 115 family protein [Candidatus Hungatella pullicola]